MAAVLGEEARAIAQRFCHHPMTRDRRQFFGPGGAARAGRLLSEIIWPVKSATYSSSGIETMSKPFSVGITRSCIIGGEPYEPGDTAMVTAKVFRELVDIFAVDPRERLASNGQSDIPMTSRYGRSASKFCLRNYRNPTCPTL